MNHSKQETKKGSHRSSPPPSEAEASSRLVEPYYEVAGSGRPVVLVHAGIADHQIVLDFLTSPETRSFATSCSTVSEKAETAQEAGIYLLLLVFDRLDSGMLHIKIPYRQSENLNRLIYRRHL